MKLRVLLSATALTSASFIIPTAAWASDPAAPTTAATLQASPAAATTDDDKKDENIIVTGSRIRKPNLDSVQPVTSIGGEEFFQQGSTNIGDTLNDLPALRSTFAQQNPGLGVGIAGLNLLDLRGLGTSRTLVLVNGRRHVAADILSNAVSPDVNTIPNDLIERVDIVTGGNSAVYGSDAIAGVVNFVLKRDFTGLQVRGNAAVSDKGFGGNQYGSVLYGKNFGDGRGNVTIHAEYANQDRIYGSDIDSFRRVDGLGVIDVDPAGLVSSSDGFPDRAFFTDFRTASIHRFGLVPITQNGTTPGCGVGLAQTNGPGASTQTAGLPASATGSPYNCTFIFSNTGQLTPQTGTRFGTGIIGSIIGGNGQTGREDTLLSVFPGQQRYNTNLLAHYSFSDAVEAFVEAKFVRVDTQGSNAGPSFIQGTFSQLDLRERIRLDNPYLSTADRTTIANGILASGCNPSLTAACAVPGITASFNRTTFGGQGTGGPLNAADIAAINAGTYRFVLSRSLLDSGIRDEKFRRDTYRVVAGLRGSFNTDWSYEISANYGKFKETTTTYGYLDRNRFLLSLDAGRATPTSAIQCRAQFDPTAAVAFAGASAAKLAADVAACVPYNPVGGADNSAAAKYFTYNATHVATLDQLDISGFVSGDLSQLFELPGGPIRFAIGGEYRREKAYYLEDPFVQSGATNAVVIPTFAPPAFEVKEAYAEFQVPILKDVPFFHELSVSAAGRVSDYKGISGAIYTYNAGGEWAPVRDIRFRANYGRAVRAPNVSETGFPVVPNFAPGFSDPCASNNIGANANRSKNCAQALTAAQLAALPTTTYSLAILSGSNPNLAPEKSDSITIGTVLQPHWVPGLSLSIDYYNIRVRGVITSLSAAAIVNGCYDQPTIPNTLCNSFQRNLGTTTGPLGELPGQILGNTLNTAPFNFAKRIRRGVDIEAAYRGQLFDGVKLNTRLLYTHQLQNSNFQSSTDPNFENRILGELGDPQDEFQFSADFTAGKITFGYQMHYLGSMYVNAYEDFNSLQGRVPENLDYADVQKYPAVIYHDLRLDVAIGQPKDGLNFFVGVDNVTDQDPPLGSTGTGTGSAIYSVRGRNLYAGFKARF